MNDINEYLSDFFACVLQYGQKETDILFEFISLDAEQLFEGIWLGLHHIIAGYFRLTGKLIQEEEFKKYIHAGDVSDEDKANYINKFLDLLQTKVKGEKFKFYAHLLKNKIMHDKAYVMLLNANRALSSELTQNKRTYKGYQGMRRYLAEKTYDLDRVFSEYSSEGAVADEIDSVIEEYHKLKDSNHYVSTGFSEVDKCTGGLFPGELWLWAGYAAEGKTSSCINIGHNVAYIQRKNVLYLTSETVTSVIMRRLISRHAFHIFNKGIDLKALKTGKLPDESVEIMQKTIKDIKEGKGKYGVFYIIQMPSSANVDFLAGALSKWQSIFNIDLCILDSIHLLTPKRQRQSEYSELGDMLIEVKKLIVSHNNGKGVPLISPWHTNRASYDNALECRHYTKTSLAKTSEAERCADVIVTILRDIVKENELKGSILKNQDGEELEEFFLKYDFRYGLVADSDIDNTVSIDFDDILKIGLN